jgi:response regulator of citrate/malate metabolism
LCPSLVSSGRVAGAHAEIVAGAAGFEVIARVHTASAALDAIPKHRPDLLLLDRYLPDASGLVLLGRIRALPEPADVIVLSAANDMESVRTAMRRGALHFLVKPFDVADLRDRGRYARLHARRSSGGALAQGEIDALFGVMGREATGAPRQPAGQSPETAQLVLRALGEAGRPLSAVELAERAGISRTTAQRYLSALADAGTLRRRPRYGATGRPEHLCELDTAGTAGRRLPR